uniref:ABC-type oligopeptide transporter ABCB9 n=1 Tax=Erpetoichthys calabaricus TaxID=27687 RepID=A0A8C4TLE6_ERPCA
MRAVVSVSCNFLFVLLDVTLTTILYIDGTQVRRFLQELNNFDIFTSTIDVWLICLIRACVLLGASTGVARNSTDGPRRVKKLNTAVSVLCMVMVVYAVAKLLLFSEVAVLLGAPWFLSLFAWSCISSLATLGFWKLLCLVKTKRELLVINEEKTKEEEGDDESEASGASIEESNKKENRGSSKATISRLLSYTKEDAGVLGVAFVFLILAALGECFIPYYTGLAVDGIVIQKSMVVFTKVLTCLLATTSFSFAAGIRGGMFNLTFARLNQEIGFFDSNHTGDITSRLTSDTTLVSDLVSQNVNICLRCLVKGVGVCIFMFSLSWKLSLVTFMGFPLVMIVSELYGKYYKRLAREVQDALAKANNIAEETISAMKTVRSFANEDNEVEVYWEKLQHMYKLNKKQALAYVALQVSVLFYGGHLVISDQMTSGNLISFIIYELELGDCMENIGSVYTGLMQGVGAAEKVFEFINRKPLMTREGTMAPDTFKGHVEFKNVSFAFPTRPNSQVLKNVTFALRPGEVTALVGPSGSGKSSCVYLMEHFYAAQSGELLLDGIPIEQYDHNYLHSKVALVGQEPVLFARSIQENIAYGVHEVTMDSVVQAAKAANAHGFITELQSGYNTDAGERGAQLSGGQKQRVAIARALVRNPHLLLMDEATSALDTESEHTVHQALEGAMHNRTILVIAHRLSTIEKAHNIIVLDKGKVSEQGNHKELMAKGGLYFKMVQRQMLGVDPPVDDKSFKYQHKSFISGGSILNKNMC